MPHQKVVALIPAAGASHRMGGRGSKALLELAGRPLIYQSVKRVVLGSGARDVVLMVPADLELQFRAIDFSDCPCSVQFVFGGATRQESVRLGVEFIGQHLSTYHDAFVLVHDAARCVVSPDDVRRVVDAAFATGAATLAAPATDTAVLASVVDGARVIGQTLPRDELWAMQTPQVFEFNLLARAHAEGAAGATDDAGLVHRLHPVQIVPSQSPNLKVTVPGDLVLAAEYVG